MLRELTVAAVFGVGTALSGCATIVHSGPRSIPIASSPPGAKVSIYDRDNNLVMTNTTPFVAKLSTKAGYFKAQNYRMEFQLAGHAPAAVGLDSSVSGWYWCNFVLGGLLGMLIVDPLTGAMYNLTPDKIRVN
jgi:hypothetical protein